MQTIKYILTEEAKEIGTKLGISFEPAKGTPFSVAYDFRAAIPEAIEIKVGEVTKIGTGIKLDLLEMFTDEEGQIFIDDMQLALILMPRSGVKNLRLENTIGLIDTDYQGQIMFKYRNSGDAPVTVQPGERIGQGYFTPTINFNFLLTEAFETPSERGEGGFNSTGAM